MKSALIHGVLLAVMLVYGYRTWTRDTTVKPDLGSVKLWDKSESDLVALEYKSDRKTVRVEQRKDASGEPYWWGVETTIEKKPKPQPPKPAEPAEPETGSAGSAADASGSAGSADAGSAGSAPTPPAPPPPPEMVDSEKVREFPIGEGGDKLVKAYAEARAIRELGVPDVDQLITYKLAEPKQLEDRIAELKKQIEDKKAAAGSDNRVDDAGLQKRLSDLENQKKQTEGKPRNTITITMKDGARAFWLGGSVYGGSDRYVIDQQSSVAYVVSKDMVSALELGESSLRLSDPRGFDLATVETVVIEWGGRQKVAARIQTGEDGKQVKTWGDADTKKANQPLANFIDNVGNFKPTEYAPALALAGIEPIVKLTYKDAKGKVLGTLGLYKVEKPGELPEGTELDPANPPKGELEYYVLTEKTRVPGLVRKDPAQRSEQDLPIVFGDKAAPMDPKDNPFKNVPVDDPHGAPQGGGGHGAHDGHGH
jgi:hypothetical protein